MTGDPVFHTEKATHDLHKNNALESDAFKTELHTAPVTEESGVGFSSQGLLSIDYTFDFLEVHFCVLFRGSHVISHECLTL